MRYMLVVTAVAAAMVFDVGTSRAYQGPWCAVQNIGHAVVYNCSMRTLEMCTQEVIARQPRILQSEPILPRARDGSAES